VILADFWCITCCK